MQWEYIIVQSILIVLCFMNTYSGNYSLPINLLIKQYLRLRLISYASFVEWIFQPWQMIPNWGWFRSEYSSSPRIYSFAALKTCIRVCRCTFLWRLVLIQFFFTVVGNIVHFITKNIELCLITMHLGNKDCF